MVGPHGHSWPSIPWWLSLTAADQGAWVSGIGALVAAGAALWVAYKPARDKRKAELGFTAAVIPALMFELVDVEVQARKLCEDFYAAAETGHDKVVSCAREARLGYLSLTLRMFDRLDWFTPDEGQAIAHVISRHAAVGEDLSALGLFPDMDTLKEKIRPEEFRQAKRASINAKNLADGVAHLRDLLAKRRRTS